MASSANGRAVRCRTTRYITSASSSSTRQAYSAQEEPFAQSVRRIECEGRLARAECRACDLRDHGCAAGDLGLSDHAADELRADDREMAKLVSTRQHARGVEEREAGGGSGAAPGPGGLSLGGNRHVALRQRDSLPGRPEEDAPDSPEA